MAYYNSLMHLLSAVGVAPIVASPLADLKSLFLIAWLMLLIIALSTWSDQGSQLSKLWASLFANWRSKHLLFIRKFILSMKPAVVQTQTFLISARPNPKV